MTAALDIMPEVIALIQQDRPDEAEQMLRQAAPLPPEGMVLLARLLHNRAAAAFQRQDIHQAETLLREAITLAPTQPESRRSLAEILLQQAANAVQTKDVLQTAAAAQAAAALWPEIAQTLPEAVPPLAAYLHDAAVAAASSQSIESARLALAAWSLTPRLADLYATCRSIFVHLGTGELGAPVEAAIFEELLRQTHDDPVALLGLSNLHRQAGRLNKAESLCRMALQQPIGQPFAAGRLASILAEQGRFAEADIFYRALDRDFAGIERNIRLDPAFMAALTPLEAPPLEMESPPAGDLVVFTSCDGRYFTKYIDAFANSLAKAHQTCLLHVHVVDPAPETQAQAEALRARHPSLPFRLTVETSPPHLNEAARRVYFACARFLRLPQLLEAYARPILMLDTDSVILRDISPLLAQARVEQADLALVFGIPREPWSRLWADILLAAPTPLAQDFLSQTARYIAHFFREGKAAWFLDQVALYATHTCGFAGRGQPKILQWPMDIQNAGLEHTYFWSLHVSQPSNSQNEQMDFYQAFKQG